MASIPPSAPDPSAPNPFEAPESSYRRDPRSYAPGEARDVEFGDLWSKSFQVACSQGTAFVFCTVPMAILLAAFTAAFHYLAGDSVLPPYDLPRYFYWQTVLSIPQYPLLVWLLCGSTKIWLDATEGKEPEIETLLTSVRWLPIGYCVSFVVDTAWGIGSIFCCVPGLLVSATGAAALSVVIAESRGIIPSLRRAYDLTLPSFWAIAGVVYCVWIIAILFLFLVSLISVAVPQEIVNVIAAAPMAAAFQYLVVVKVVAYRLASGSGVVLAGAAHAPSDSAP